MGEELKPCPLCGSTDIACFAEECGDGYDNVPTFRAVVGCRGCHEEGCDSTYDDEPCFGIEAYYRADHPLVKDCEDPSDCERVLERHMAERWNRRSGQTCHVESSRTEWEYGEYSYLDVELSCGHAFTWDDVTPPDYCPYCGKRVVSE